MKKLRIMSMLMFGTTAALQAQNQDAGVWAESIVTPQFFIAVIAGVLLALGFQFILTVLSVALGITAIGDVREKYVESKLPTDADKDNNSDDMSTGTKVTGAFGIWSVLTVSISLFGATALAINLSLISNPVISITLGLVVWATFFILLFYLESKMVNTLVGGLINTATAGLRASGNAVKEMFSTSKEEQFKNVAEDTVDKIRRDFSASFDPDIINDSIDEFFNRVDQNVPDYEKLKRDIEDIVEKSSEDEKQKSGQSGGGGQGKWMAIQQVFNQAISEVSDGDDDKSKKEQLQKLQKELKQAYDEGDTKEEKLEKVTAKLSDKDEEEIHSYTEKIKEMLSKTSPGDMDQGRMKDKMMEIVNNPEVEASRIADSLQQIDRDTIIEFLSKNTALKKDQIEKYSDKVEDTLNKIVKEIGSKTGNEGADASELKEKLQVEVSKFINGNGKSNINTSMITRYFQDKFDNSKDDLQVVKKNLTNLDKDTLSSAVTKNTNIDQKDIDKVVDSIQEARDNVLKKVEDIETEARRRMENIKRKSVIQAEHTRKVAAAAAWWLVVSAVLSAGTAIVGSLVAMG